MMDNEASPKRLPVALIAGPTASGKSDLAVKLGFELKKRGKRPIIINADSSQIYRELQILSARPTTKEMRGIEHMLFAHWPGTEVCSAAKWAAEVKKIIRELPPKNVTPIIVGGTGMYMQVLLRGISPIPRISTRIREDIRKMPVHMIFAELKNLDPESASKINSNDTQRLSRALEVIQSTGKSIYHWRTVKSGGIENKIDLHPLIMLPDRAWLYDRCDRRFEKMVETGAIEEVKALIAAKIPTDAPILKAIGVREITSYLKGDCTKDEMVQVGQQNTRNYAKRQYTWFRNQCPEKWPVSHSVNIKIDTFFEVLLQS